MLDFVRKAFRGGLEVILWINLILFMISGGVIANTIEDDFIILGVIAGIVFGLISNILMGGFIATILNIDANIEFLASKNTSGSSSSRVNSSQTNSSNTPSPPPINRNYGDTWTCKKCGEKNPITASSCKECGAYK